MSAVSVLTLMLLLLVKHFIADFLLQRPYQYLNKGKYGHPGGILHSAIHGIGTLLVLFIMAPVSLMLVALSLFDAVTHYHIDWLKVNINNENGWTATTSENFWHLVGADQLAHQIIYVCIIFILI